MSKTVQSYYSVMFRQPLTIYEMRIMLQVVKHCEVLTKKKGITYKQLASGNIVGSDFVGSVVAVPMAVIMGQSHSGYDRVKNAFRSLVKKNIEYYDAHLHKWFLSAIITDVVIDESKGTVAFRLPKIMIDYITDFSQGGYVLYDWEAAFKMRNIYAARLYTMFSSLGKVMVFGYENLLKAFGVENKYRKLSDFERRVLEPAIKEIEKKVGRRLNYEVIRETPARKSSKVIGIRFFPMRTVKSLEEKESRSVLSQEHISALARVAGLSWREISANKPKFVPFFARSDWSERLYDVVSRARNKGRNHGWIISALQRIGKEQENSNSYNPNNN